jgi:hypothetical protein
MKTRRSFLIAGTLATLAPATVLANDPARKFKACLQKVHNRGTPPESFLNELVDWARLAPDEIFTPNNKQDIYSSIAGELGPWKGTVHRKAAMLEVLRVLGGFESSWNWNAAVDTTNPNSNKPCTEEAGIFQCSGDSMSYDPVLKNMLLTAKGKNDCDTFRAEVKKNHQFAIEYCARLIRFTTRHHGPIRDKHINPWLRKDAVEEFTSFLS